MQPEACGHCQERFLFPQDLPYPGQLPSLPVHDPCLPAYLPRSDLLYDPEIPVLHKAALSYSESVPVMFSDIRP